MPMTFFGSSDPANTEDNFADFIPLLFLLFSLLTTMMYLMMKCINHAEKRNELDYEDKTSRVIAGFIRMLMEAIHFDKTTLGQLDEYANTDTGKLEPKIVELDEQGNEINKAKAPKKVRQLTLKNGLPPEAAIAVAGPHRAGALDAAAVALSLKGRPPRFFATDSFNGIPGVKSFMEKFQVIFIGANNKKTTGRSANFDALDKASEALQNGDRVALFPQGNFSLSNQVAPKVYDGAARLAIRNKKPIYVLRLDGYNSIESFILPRMVTDSPIFRAFVSFFMANNIRVSLCLTIDYHLQEENVSKPEEELICEINAQMYAFYNVTKSLKAEQIEKIHELIDSGEHRKLWEARQELYKARKALTGAEQQYKIVNQVTTEQLAQKPNEHLEQGREQQLAPAQLLT